MARFVAQRTRRQVLRCYHMALSIQVLASGPGWSVRDVICGYGPHDHSFVEEHREVAIASVHEGCFQYRTETGSATLVPGSLLLGNAGSCFECGHEHAQGDRCLAFHFAPGYFDRIAADAPRVRRMAFAAPSVPPTSELAGLIAAAEVARNEHDVSALEEIATQLAGTALAITAEPRGSIRGPTAHDERRITKAIRRIEAQSETSLGLTALANEAAMSPYHFLRTFRQVTGVTPHQYVLRRRLHHAATTLRSTAEPVSAIAYRVGFKDLATFNRRFRRAIGTTPSVYRTAAASAASGRLIRGMS